ncbi:hypothetical protein GCM10011416_14370 [Polaribacter pacificus]|uniref:Transglutaminase-like domain-containing protein n=1 Tax=Polaribacter pacificus TaxID=1775173 RepID=A0A917MDS3_9FLAO|nr:transglutaminase domain-containing protein [Polaribacter pacificus]GGG97478.1 hypothetical protein GCM10011416_14370 [Polaribacter pacificus]
MNRVKLITLLIVCLFSFQSNGQNLTNRKLIKIAKNAPDSISGFASDIADYFKTKTKDPKELVFLFSYWIGQNISYNVEKHLTGDTTYTDIWDTLKTKKTMCQGFSELFSEICYWADIESEIIVGYAKGIDFNGKPLKGTNHIWNAVLINNKWELVDITWAVGFIDFRNGKYVFNKKFRKQYIFAKPDDLIITHLPVKSKWQLSTSSITFNEFFSDVHEKKRQSAFNH